MTPLRAIIIKGGRAWAGLESEPVVEGRHPRVAAMALAVRLYGKTADVRELNAYNYSVALPAPAETKRP